QPTRLAPRLLERGDRRPLWPTERPPAEASDECLSVLVLGTRSASFLLESNDESGATMPYPIPSNAGFASLTRCGPRRAELAQLTVVLRSSRALLETVWLESSEPLPPLSELLPSRDPGSAPPAPRIGARPALGETAPRIRAVEQWNARHGARSQNKSQLVLDSSGQGTLPLNLGPGCHRISLLAVGASDANPDLDANLTLLSSGEELSRDEGESPQPELRHCSARAERYVVAVSGGSPGSPVLALSAEWQLPDGLPIEWGPLAQASMAVALWRDLPPRVHALPSHSFLGVQGRTDVWLDTRPDGCYLLGVAAMRGSIGHLTLEWQGPHVDGRSHAGRDEAGTSGAFCAEGASRVLVRITTTGEGLAWLLAAWEFPETP
ncbi:MAG TPA: hypothetical protein VLC09_19120, partial [Polyangiaceae bacterium]|nr:hypothetical protein [Polyangiaceae bacterium]